MKPEQLTKRYRDARTGCEDYRLTNMVTVAADLLFKLAMGYYDQSQEDSILEMVEGLITQYSDNKHKERKEKICEFSYIWAVKYSYQQDRFFTEKLEDVLLRNMTSVIRKEQSDFLIYGIYHTEEQARDKMEQVNDKRRRAS